MKVCDHLQKCITNICTSEIFNNMIFQFVELLFWIRNGKKRYLKNLFPEKKPCTKCFLDLYFPQETKKFFHPVWLLVKKKLESNSSCPFLTEVFFIFEWRQITDLLLIITIIYWIILQLDEMQWDSLFQKLTFTL